MKTLLWHMQYTVDTQHASSCYLRRAGKSKVHTLFTWCHWLENKFIAFWMLLKGLSPWWCFLDSQAILILFFTNVATLQSILYWRLFTEVAVLLYQAAEVSEDVRIALTQTPPCRKLVEQNNFSPQVHITSLLWNLCVLYVCSCNQTDR